MTDIHEQVRTLRNDAEHPLPFLPIHMWARAAALAGDEETQYLDGYGPERLTAENLEGMLLLITEKLVVCVSGSHPEFQAGQHPEASSVTAEAWPRSSLRSITVAEGAEQGHNLDVMWEGARTWPRTGRLILTYPHRDLTLPLRDTDVTRAQLTQLLPTLLADLAQGPGAV